MLTVEQYQAIADRAVEIIGSLDSTQFMTAWEVMKDETTVIDLPEARHNELSIMRLLGMVTGGALLDKLESAFPARVNRAIQGDGIDLAHSETKQVLSQLKGASVITQAEYDALIGLTKKTVFVYPFGNQTRVRPGEVQNALQQREEGLL